MKRLLIVLLVWLISLNGESQQPTPDPSDVFRLNVLVTYSGATDHPELATHLYAKLRAIPGVAVVPAPADYVFTIDEIARGNEYACACIVTSSAGPAITFTFSPLSMIPPSDHGDHWRQLVNARMAKMNTPCYLEDHWIVIHESPQAAIDRAVSLFAARFVERKHREWDAPVVLPPFNPPIIDPKP